MDVSLSADGSTSWFTNHQGRVFVQAAGTFGGGTLKIETSVDGGATAQAVEGGSYSSGPITQALDLPVWMPIRLTLSGATTPSIAGMVAEMRV